MGAVFEAVHVATGKRFALKVMHAPRAHKPQEDEAARLARFQREALAVGRLETQHVAQVFDAGFDEASRAPFIVMELLEGEDVSRLIRRNGPLRVELAVAIVAQACVGLAKAHENGVVHRDIKPGNLFLTRNEYGEHIVKVLDFGIAKQLATDEAFGSELATITETGTLMGSPHYMSPEQAKGLRSIDHRADLWSLGVVLHRCLSGRTPFDAASTLGQVIVAVCSEAPASVQEHAPWVPSAVAEVIRTALQRDPAARFQSALEMHDALRSLLPSGPRITEDMLGPLPAELRELAAAARAGMPEWTPSFGSDASTGRVGGLATSTAFPPEARALSRETDSTKPAFAAQEPGPKAKGRALPIVVAASAILAFMTIGSVIAVRVTRSTPTASAPPSSAPAAAQTVTPVGATEPRLPLTALAAPSAATPPASSAAASAAATIAGKPAEPARGAHRGVPRPATSASGGPNRLQGGVGSDVPF